MRARTQPGVVIIRPILSVRQAATVAASVNGSPPNSKKDLQMNLLITAPSRWWSPSVHAGHRPPGS
jgi:hypothetical protein